MVRPINEVLDSLNCCVRELEIHIQDYERFVVKLGLKQLTAMSISEKVKTAEFICQIRSTYGESQKTDGEAKNHQEEEA